MAEIRLTTWDVWNPINAKNYLSTGAGFQPSTVGVVFHILGAFKGHLEFVQRCQQLSYFRHADIFATQGFWLDAVAHIF